MSIGRSIYDFIGAKHQSKRLLRRIALLCVFIYAFVFYFHLQPRPNDGSLTSKETVSIRHDFYHKLFKALLSCQPSERPDIESFRDINKCQSGDIQFNPAEVYKKGSYENLNSCFHLTEDQLHDLKTKHAQYVDIILQNLEVPDDLIDVLFPNDEGIVTIGGGRFSVISLGMIETLRDKGSTLPVEVIIPPADEGEDDYCNNVLPKLNAKCVYFSDVLPKDSIGKFQIKRYQYKVIGLLISSFKKILFVDADNFPLANVDDIFEKPIFKETGLIIWPDIWRRVTAPDFYEVANIDINLNHRVRYLGDDVSPISRYQSIVSPPNLFTEVPLHDLEGAIPDPTSESGQIVVDKVAHLSTLLLATYYNVHESWYYKMLSQGTSGEGDKETFIAAAHALKNPYYQVRTRIDFDGFFDHTGAYHGVALYQHDFQQDYEQHERAKQFVEDNMNKYAPYDPSYNVHDDFYDKLMKLPNGESIDALFAHAGLHKFDPFDLAKDRIYMDEDGKHFRGFQHLDVSKGFDIELFNFKVYENSLCTDKPIHFKYYAEKMKTAEWSSMCQYLNERVNFLQATHKSAMSGQSVNQD